MARTKGKKPVQATTGARKGIKTTVVERRIRAALPEVLPAAKGKVSRWGTQIGIPTTYKTEYERLAFNHCLLTNATNEELGALFGVEEHTIIKWREQFPEFNKAILEGKENTDSRVAAKLVERALGYTVEETHISNYMGNITKTPTLKHYPPETTAAIFWLKNRQPKHFREKQEIEQNTKVEVTVQRFTEE